MGSSIWARCVVLIACLAMVNAFFPSSIPEYCNRNPSEQRRIPPLSDDQLTYVDSLEQVQVLIRHGARTPYMKYQCWKDYDIEWNNCNVTELMIPSPSMTNPSRPAPWLFRKLYDGSPNALGGNCFTGQLLSEGYNQELQNGQFLRNNYLDSDLPLFPTSVWTDIDTENLVYLRSDDEQRTVMSGQILLHGMFNISDESIVPWHTGDYSLDQIYPNSGVCPKLDTLEDSIYQTPEFVQYNTSKATQTLVKQLDSILGAGQWSWNYIFDCMLTTVCSGRGLPEGMTDSLFNQTLAHVQWTEAYLNAYNHSQWAKLAMSNTAYHVRSNLEALVDSNRAHSLSVSGDSAVPKKFVLFSGHDTTIEPFTAALLQENWDGKWPGYASLVSLEVYRSSKSGFASGYVFRMIYNGQVVMLPDCTAAKGTVVGTEGQLCDVSVLLQALSFGVESASCSVQTESDGGNTDSDNDCNDSSLSTLEWSLLLVGVALFSALLGAALVVFFDRQRMMSLRDMMPLSTAETRDSQF